MSNEWRDVPISECDLPKPLRAMLEARGITTLGKFVDFFRDNSGRLMVLMDGADQELLAKLLHEMDKARKGLARIAEFASAFNADKAPKPTKR